MIFANQYDEEIFNEYGRWKTWINNIFLPLINTETGDFNHFPYAGTILDQGFVSMEILYIIQNAYRKNLHEKMSRFKK